MADTAYCSLDARTRVAAMLDPGFQEFLPPPARVTSPYLEALGQPAELDDGIVVGRGLLRGRPVLFAAQQGAFVGGAVGEVHGAKLTGLIRAGARAAAEDAEGAAGGPVAGVVLLLESGGVRLHEGSAGEIGISEAMRAVFEAREAGCPVIAVIGGNIGAYGGIGILAACCDRVVMTEHGRWGISGPIVIEQQMGAEEYDADDRALVWRTSGGKTRYALGDADVLVDDSVEAVADAVAGLLGAVAPMDLLALRASHERLARRLHRFAGAVDGADVWTALGVADLPTARLASGSEFSALPLDRDGIAR